MEFLNSEPYYASKKIVNQSSDFPVRRTGSYRHKSTGFIYERQLMRVRNTFGSAGARLSVGSPSTASRGSFIYYARSQDAGAVTRRHDARLQRLHRTVSRLDDRHGSRAVATWRRRPRQPPFVTIPTPPLIRPRDDSSPSGGTGGGV